MNYLVWLPFNQEQYKRYETTRILTFWLENLLVISVTFVKLGSLSYHEEKQYEYRGKAIQDGEKKSAVGMLVQPTRHLKNKRENF